MSSFCKIAKTTHIFFSKNISIYAVFNDRSFNDTLTNDIVSFEQLGPDLETDRSSKVLNLENMENEDGSRRYIQSQQT